MSLRAVVDNDILAKGACYGAIGKMAAAIPIQCDQVGFLGAAPFVIRAKMREGNICKEVSLVARYFECTIRRMRRLEPTQEEISLAAELERIAQLHNFALDFGESQLCAITVLRELDWLITGDKRAIRAFQGLLSVGAGIDFLKNRIICLEQLIFAIAAFLDTRIGDLICSEPKVDRALSICFSCDSRVKDIKSWLTGLRSYIESLRTTAPSILMNN